MRGRWRLETPVVRAFLAIELEEPVRDAVSSLSDRLRACTAKVSWTKPENAHVTLRFLGDVDTLHLDRLIEVLEPAYAAMPGFRMTVGGVGCFPNLRQPRVVWVGARPDSDVLGAIHYEAEHAARHIGLDPETKKYTPHVTLGRLRDPRECGDLVEHLERERDFRAGDNVVGRVALLESKLSPKGATYSLIREFPLIWTT